MKQDRNKHIHCDVQDCKYNHCDSNYCKLNEIKVCSCAPQEEKEATMCDSYVRKEDEQ